MKKNSLIHAVTLFLLSFNGLAAAEQIQSSPSFSNTLRSINISNGQSGEIVAKLTLEQALPAAPVGAALNNRSFNAAKIVVSTIPLLIIYPFLQKYFVTGMVIGAVKE